MRIVLAVIGGILGLFALYMIEKFSGFPAYRTAGVLIVAFLGLVFASTFIPGAIGDASATLLGAISSAIRKAAGRLWRKR